MLYSLKDVFEICFYLPYKIEKKEIKDLGEVLFDKEVLNAVFNENYSMLDDKQPKIKMVKKDDELEFKIYHLDINNDVDVEHKYDGSIIKIKTTMITGRENKVYFRFRIKSNLLSELVKKRQPKNIFLQSAITEECFIDFRFNDIRSLNSSLVEEMNNELKSKINKIHFLLLTRAEVEHLSDSEDKKNERQLEVNLWEKYLKFKPETIISANHWKIKDRESCDIYIKFRVNKCNAKTISAYVFVLGILSVIFNLISQWIIKFLGLI